MKSIRIALFAPGSKERVMAKALESGADAVLLDLEDSVPLASKAEARSLVAKVIDGVAAAGAGRDGPAIFVRTNAAASGLLEDDLAAIVRALLLPLGDGFRPPLAAMEWALRASVIAGAFALVGLFFAALNDADKARQMQEQIAAAGVKSYTEVVPTVKGKVTRVRAGPFASRGEAEKMRDKLKGMGLAGNIIPK